MARKPKKSAENGAHNLDPNADSDQQALLIYHINRLRQQAVKVAEAKAALDGERSTLTDLFTDAKGDHFKRKELQALMDDLSASRRNLAAEEERRAKLRAWLSLPAGAQSDLFASTPQEAKDEMAWEGDGYAAGLRGDVCEVAEGVPARHVSSWTRGWHDGQEKLAWGLAAAGRVVDRRTDIAPQAVRLEPEPDEDEADERDAALAGPTAEEAHIPEEAAA